MGNLAEWWPVVALPLGWLFYLVADLRNDIKELRKEKDKHIKDLKDDVSRVAVAFSDSAADLTKRLDDLLLELWRNKR